MKKYTKNEYKTKKNEITVDKRNMFEHVCHVETGHTVNKRLIE